MSEMLSWHNAFPVSSLEKKRNDDIYTKYQGNRNPFIDYPRWVEQVFLAQAQDDSANKNAENERAGTIFVDNTDENPDVVESAEVAELVRVLEEQLQYQKETEQSIEGVELLVQ